MDALHITHAACALALVAALVWRIIGPRRTTRLRLPYTKRALLLTPAELRFYRVLLQAVPQGMTVFVKVRLMDVVNLSDKAWGECGSSAGGMHLDFVLAGFA
jgi:hypothetical protein